MADGVAEGVASRVGIPRTVAVIGGGPRGISVLERLLANAPELGVDQLRIVVIEPYRVGGGRIWDADQPGHLLMNTLCADATHFTDDTVEIAGPVRPGPTLYEWGLRVRSGEVTDLGSADRPVHAEVHAEVQGIRPHSHPSRRFLGAYLEWCLAQDRADAPAGCEVEMVQGTAHEVRPAGRGRPGWEIEVVRSVPPTDPGAEPEAGRTVLRADAVVLATGHSDIVPHGGGAELARSARQQGLFHAQPTNPISQSGLDRLGAGQPVIVRGLGMNFFDYLSMLTIGRGGRFRETPEGPDALEYEPSGLEPVLHAGSGRGVPYRAKGRFGGMTPSFPTRHFTPELMEQLVRQAQEGPPIDFREQMLPAIMKDGLHRYYSVLARTRPQAFAGDPEAILTALDDLDWGSPQLDQAIADVVPEASHRIAPHRLDRPLDGHEFPDQDALTRWWLQDLRHDLAEADRGLDSALKCASVQIGAGRGPLRTLVRYGGVRGVSYARDVEGWFRGFGGMLASGPPARRIEELIALVRVGIVRPLGARMRVEVEDGAFTVSSPTIPGGPHGRREIVRASAMLEAHLPAADLAHTANPVLASLRDTGRARPFVIPDHREVPFVSGALAVGPPPYRVLDAEGRDQAGLYAVGVPLESVLWGTQLQPLARTNSRMLRETDAVARDALCPGADVRASRPGRVRDG